MVATSIKDLKVGQRVRIYWFDGEVVTGVLEVRSGGDGEYWTYRDEQTGRLRYNQFRHVVACGRVEILSQPEPECSACRAPGVHPERVLGRERARLRLCDACYREHERGLSS